MCVHGFCDGCPQGCFDDQFYDATFDAEQFQKHMLELLKELPEVPPDAKPHATHHENFGDPDIVVDFEEITRVSKHMIEYFRHNVLNFQYEKMKDYIDQLECLVYPPYKKREP
jgi:hypothetical protein